MNLLNKPEFDLALKTRMEPGITRLPNYRGNSSYQTCLP
jgi:hypothetical protein